MFASIQLGNTIRFDRLMLLNSLFVCSVVSMAHTLHIRRCSMQKCSIVCRHTGRSISKRVLKIGVYGSNDTQPHLLSRLCPYHICRNDLIDATFSQTYTHPLSVSFRLFLTFSHRPLCTTSLSTSLETTSQYTNSCKLTHTLCSPLVAQFCSNNPSELLKSALYVQVRTFRLYYVTMFTANHAT